MKLKRYSKAIAAFCGALAVWGATASADGHYSAQELWGLLGVGAVTYATYAAPRNKL